MIFSQLPNFLETSPANVYTICHRLEIFTINFEMNRKHPSALAPFRLITFVISNSILPRCPARSIQEDSFVTSRIRCFRFSSGFPHYFLSFPAGQICFCCPSGLLYSLQPLSRAVLSTYSSSFGFNSGRASFFIALSLLDRFSNISFLKVALHGTRAPQLFVFF